MKIKTFRNSILSIGILFSTFELVNATQFKEVLDNAEIEAFISADDISRIKAVNDRIRSVKTNQGEIELLEDKELGEVYLRPAGRNLAPLNMFVTTEKNYTYKLLLLPKKMPSEQIFLKNSEASGDNSQKQSNDQKSFKEKVIALIKAMRAGENIDGYKREPFIEEKKLSKVLLEFFAESIDQENPFEITKISSHKGKELIGEVLEFKNTYCEPLLIDYEQIEKSEKNKIIAISIDRAELMPEESTKVYLVREVK